MSKPSPEYLLIFDFDDTLVDCNAPYDIADKLQNKENAAKYKYMDEFVSFHDAFLFLFERKNALSDDWDNFNKIVTHVKFIRGMEELLNYLKDKKVNKNNFDVIMDSGDVDYILRKNLEKIRCDGLIKTYLCYHTKPTPDNPTTFLELINDLNNLTTCDDCNPNLCKTHELKEFLKKEENNSYKTKIVICDGGNDFCLAKNLGKNDILFCRKNYGLYKKLYGKGLSDKIKAKIILWDDGVDLMKEIKGILEK